MLLYSASDKGFERKNWLFLTNSLKNGLGSQVTAFRLPWWGQQGMSYDRDGSTTFPMEQLAGLWTLGYGGFKPLDVILAKTFSFAFGIKNQSC